jgi:hypothetical protein
MGSQLQLAATLVRRAARADRRTTVLSALLVALPVFVSIVAMLWTSTDAALATPTIAALVWVALAVGDPGRAELGTHLWVSGGRAGPRVLVVVLQAALVGGAGIFVGVAAGLTVAGAAVALAGAAPLTIGGVLAVVVAGLVGTAIAGLIAAARAVRNPQLPSVQRPTDRRRRVRWWVNVVGGCTVLLVVSVWTVGANSRTFGDFDSNVLFFSPFAVVGTAGLAVAALGAVSVLGPRTSGPLWFAMRSVGRDRRRTGPLAGLIAVLVAICVVGAVFSASFTEREARAADQVQTGVRPAWVSGDSQPDVGSLGRSALVMQDPRDALLLSLAIGGFLVCAVGTAVAMSASARRREDELIVLQGGDDWWARRVNGAEALVLAATGVVVGTAVALAATAYGFWLYDRDNRVVPSPVPGRVADQIYPPVPFVVPWGVVLVVVVVLPLVAAVLAAVLTPRDDAVRLGFAAEASAPVYG